MYLYIVKKIKTSAAAQKKQVVKLEVTSGLIQAISDNFDANLSTQNGLKQTQSLA